MDTDKTFAYIAFAVDWTAALRREIDRLYHGDVIEVFMESEDDADDAAELWGFDWEEWMSRIAPVQLTKGLDVRTIATELFGAGTILGVRTQSDSGSIQSFDCDALEAAAHAKGDPDIDDLSRCRAVLRATSQLAIRECRDLLLVAGQGWGYDMEVSRSVRSILKRSKYQFHTRHVAARRAR